MPKVVKKRNWAFIVYPESAVSDWVERLKQTGLPAAISPLHDKDVHEDGSPKKAHYHVIVCYNGPTSFDVVSRITEELKAFKPKAVENMSGYYPYLWHEHEIDKAHYEKADVQLLNGFKIGDYVEYTRSEIGAMKREIHQLIIDLDLSEYSDLMDYLFMNDKLDLWDVASCNTIYFNNYLTSRRHKGKGGDIDAQANNS